MRSKVAKQILGRTPFRVRLKVYFYGLYVVYMRKFLYICIDIYREFFNNKKESRMDIFPKFLVLDTVEEGIICVASKCTYHRMLVPEYVTVNSILGGGFFDYTPDSKSYNFYGSSSQYGVFDYNALVKTIKENNVYGDSLLVNKCENIVYKFSINGIRIDY